MGAVSLAKRVEVARRSARLERLRARAPKYLFLAFIAITSLVGIRQILDPARPVAASAPALAVPDAVAEDFALQFTRAYLDFDPAHPLARERALRRFLPTDLDPEAGLTPGHGERRVGWTQVSSEQRSPAGTTTIVVAAGDGAAPPLYLAVPVEARGDGSLGLGGYPALVGPPPVVRGSLPDRAEVEDQAVITVSRRVVANYLAGEAANLAADLVPKADVTLPSRELQLRSLDDVAWADGSSSNAVLVTAEARDPGGGRWTLTYELGITRRAARPYVTYIGRVPGSA